MRIGNNELNEKDSAWLESFAEDIANQANKQIISALNMKCSREDIKGVLAYIWKNSKKEEPKVVETPEVFEDETEDEEEF